MKNEAIDRKGYINGSYERGKEERAPKDRGVSHGCLYEESIPEKDSGEATM